MAQKRTKEKIS